MVLHSSLAAATAAAHVQDMLAEARRDRRRPTTGATLRRILRLLVHGTADRAGLPRHPVAESGAHRRYAVSR